MSGMCSSMPMRPAGYGSKFGADREQRGARWSNDDVTRMQFVVVIRIRNVRDVDLSTHIWRDRVFRHELHGPISGRGLDDVAARDRRGGGGSGRDIADAAADLQTVPGKVVLRPRGQGMARCVGGYMADLE